MKREEKKLREDIMYWYNHFPVPEHFREALFEDIVNLVKLHREEVKRKLKELINRID